MAAFPIISPQKIEELYSDLESAHRRFLKKDGVSLPSLRKADGFTQTAIALVGLYSVLGERVTKSELTDFVRNYVEGARDLQEGRHLATQKGWYIVSGARNDPETRGWPTDTYSLLSIEKAFPGWEDPKLKNPDWALKNRKPFALLNPKLILNSPDFVQREVYKILAKKFQP